MIMQRKKHLYMDMAKAAARFSKDGSTQVGALILGPEGEGGPWGYNGQPRGFDDNNVDRAEYPLKASYYEHAERNAIYAAARQGFPVKGCSMIVTKFPCPDCARAMVQSGIVMLVTTAPDREGRWKALQELSQKILHEAGILVDVIGE